jgi:predicted acyl esterase
VELQPTFVRLATGERLRLSLAPAAWPQIAVNPGDGSLPAGGSGPAHRIVTLRLRLAEAVLQIGPFPAMEPGAD